MMSIPAVLYTVSLGSSVLFDDREYAQARSHGPGRIQPHGALLAIRSHGPAGVVAASSNAAAMLWGESSSGAVIGRDLADILGPRFAADVQERLQTGGLRGEAPWRSALQLDGQTSVFHVAVHAHAGLINVELERARARDPADAQTALRDLQNLMVDLHESGSDLSELAQASARGVRRLTGYESVVVYKFDSDWTGQGIGEDRIDGWDCSLAGLHFPAAEIPVQSRELYRGSPMRWVPDRDAVPVSLVHDPDWRNARNPVSDVDQSFGYLRCLSPRRLRIHRDLGINGSMSFPILHRGRLWGLMICHHRQAHYPSPGQRSAAAALTAAFALRIGAAEHAHKDRTSRADRERVAKLLDQIAAAEVVNAALAAGDVTVGDLFASNGAAVLYDDKMSLLGNTPGETEIRALVDWLRTRYDATNLFQTNNLAAAYPPWQRQSAVANGVLAVFLSADRSDVLLWFRSEQVQSQDWGDWPRDSMADKLSTLPEYRYERWFKTRRGVARPWEDWELEVAETLRHGIAEVMVRSLQRIAELTKMLRQCQKMEAVGHLAGGIAHDFNNLLATMLGSMELLRSRVAQRRYDDLDEYLDEAIASIGRAAALTRRLLAFSRRQKLEAGTVDVKRLASSMEDLIGRSVGPAIDVEMAMSDGLWKTLCDANQFENALLNLAINARDAMPEGGHLTIGAVNIQLGEDSISNHPEIAPGEYVVVSVTDTGVGMAADVIAQVFEPFFTTKPAGEGTGLGLAMVHGFAKQAKGSVSIDSEPGLGTTVRVYLPRDVELRARKTGRLKRVRTIATESGKTVLVVDDEPALRRLLGETLRDLGYRVIEAADGAEGLRVLQSKQEIDLLVSDIGLPGGMDGRQLANAAIALRSELKVLFITGYAEDDGPGADVPASNMQVVVKPFAFKLLAAKIQTII
jgi:light-regulated signal transduction histidine kinase (bacteriophytochrome)/CheY-like chemotaxis protein